MQRDPMLLLGAMRLAASRAMSTCSSMRLAEKLLAKHSLKEADVLADDHVPEALKAGKAVRCLRSS